MNNDYSYKYSTEISDGEYWWGGTSKHGVMEPFCVESSIQYDMMHLSSSNQTMPLFISNKGRVIWSERPFEVSINDGRIEINARAKIESETFGNSLKEAFIGASNKFFPPTGNCLKSMFFEVPQYNTWMQLVYEQSQKGVMDYAESIVANGFKPGILIIDEGWQREYGNWVFDTEKFPDAKEMIEKLHQMGFKVMLWVTPNVRPDGKNFVMLSRREFNPDADKLFLRTENGDYALMNWWNGYSAILDCTKECDRSFLKKQLDKLINEYGIDGFKFDGGPIDMYAKNAVGNVSTDNSATPDERNIAWNEFGLQYGFHEYKDTFKGGGKRAVQRIRDRNHSWTHDGIDTLVPNALVQGLMGYPFICPDMIGGGEWTIKENRQAVDQELFVRMAQCSALFPMMQFSWAPWEAVDEYHLSLIKKAHDLHIDFAREILKFVNSSYETGEPIIRPLDYNYPNCGYERINDEFMLGEEYLVAPILKKGQTEKTVHLPTGKWLGFNGKEYVGGKEIALVVTLEDLPYFKRCNCD